MLERTYLSKNAERGQRGDEGGKGGDRDHRALLAAKKTAWKCFPSNTKTSETRDVILLAHTREPMWAGPEAVYKHMDNEYRPQMK